MGEEMKTSYRFLFFAVCFVFIACSDKYVPTEISPIVFPSAPANLKAKVGDGVVELSWVIRDTMKIVRFHVYRQDSLSRRWALMDSVLETKYIDHSVRNGYTYYYRVSAVNSQLVEGPYSNIVRATPNVYGIVINGGAEYTRSLEVTLNFIASLNTAFMILSKDSSFADVEWEPFVPTKKWHLSGGDGKKTVYVKYRDRDGNETQTWYKDSIFLDTIARIYSLIITPGKQLFSGGDTLHIRMTTGEAGGNAWVDFGTLIRGILLYDDGSNGDSLAGDGIYEVDFVIPENLETENVAIVGYFQDLAGNQAVPYTAATKISVQKPPGAVTLLTPGKVHSRYDLLYLSWSRADIPDFSEYRLFRSEKAGVDEHASLAAVIRNIGQTAVLDSGLKANTTYFYRVYVYDTYGFRSASNEVSATTPEDAPPKATVLNDPSQVEENPGAVFLSWSRSTDFDFAGYRLYTSEQQSVDTLSNLLASIDDRNVTELLVTNLKRGARYYFRVYVYDRAGQAAGSNIVFADIPADSAPSAVTLFSPSLITESVIQFSWSMNQDEDFFQYRVFRDVKPGVTEASTLLATIADRTTTVFQDNDLKPGTDYYYRVFVFDKAGNSSASNELHVRTETNKPPRPVILSQPTLLGSNTVRITWSQNHDTDFDAYLLLRSTESPVDTTLTPVVVINDPTVTSYIDLALKAGETYYYILVVRDRYGLQAKSNEVSIHIE